MLTCFNGAAGRGKVNLSAPCIDGRGQKSSADDDKMCNFVTQFIFLHISRDSNNIIKIRWLFHLTLSSISLGMHLVRKLGKTQ
jgi:hypothetical protein